jgi:hypothetical protein
MIQTRHMSGSRFLPLSLSTTDSEKDTPLLPSTIEPGDDDGVFVFVNQGPFSFMEPYLDLLGFKPGRQIMGAIPQEAANSMLAVPMTEQEAERRRRAAEMEMVNISDEERQRRLEIAKVAAFVSALYISWATLIADQGDMFGHFLRFAAFVPLVLAWGFYQSGKQGL